MVPMLKSKLYERTLYLNKEIDYLFNCEIREYDLKSAGLNLIKYFKLLPQDKIDYLSKMDKVERNKEIGMLQKNKDFAKVLKDAFTEARRMFFDANNIEDYEVLSVKKDAIFIIRKLCFNNTFGDLEFRVKNQYLGYMHLNNKEFYYTDPETPLDVKGFGADVEYYHGEYMLDFIRDVFTNAIYCSRLDAIRELTKFVSAYRHKYLDYGYYRMLDEEMYYDVIDDGERFKVKDVESDDVNIDITYNYFKYIIPIACIFID